MKRDRIIRAFIAIVLAMAMIIACPPSAAKAGGVDVRRGVKGTWVPTPMEGVLAYLLPDGTYLRDAYTADGYYVNKNSFWAQAYAIFGYPIPARNSWLTADAVGDFEGLVPIMHGAQEKLTTDLHGWRVISVYSTHIALYSVENTNTERNKVKRLAMYKNPDINGYTIQVCTPLAGDEQEMTDTAGEWSSMAFYDYQILRVMMYCVSRSGDKVAQAIYSSWMDTNSDNLKVGEWVTVGDTMIKYVPSNGAGLYEIKAAF